MQEHPQSENSEPTIPSPRAADTDQSNQPANKDNSDGRQPYAEPTAVHAQAVPASAAARPIYRRDSYLPPAMPLSESAARSRVRRRKTKGRGGGDWAWVIIAAAIFGVVITISLSFFLLLRNPAASQEVLPTAPVVSILPTAVDARTNLSGVNTGQVGSVLELPDGSSFIIEPWDGQSRFTMLLIGLDRRPGESGLAYRTDTMMLVSIDPASQRIGILSIPRDLYVVIPGYSQRQRVNSAMVLGEIQRPGYGPQLAMQTVQYNFGIRVHDYLIVDFQAVIAIIDAIGGIDVDVPYNISDPRYPDMYYGYDPFYISAGSHHLDGATALKYARTRHGSSDLDRAERQQQVMFAVRDRVLNLEMLPSLIVQAPALWQTLSENVYTGLTLEQIIQLGLYASEVPSGNIYTGVVTWEYVRDYFTGDGQQVLIPDQGRLGPLMVEVFGANYSE